ncbi:hypothetical protein HYFRA_00011634 [Hymenoscyphus fraxineus]|uniref:Uncharacterized protein n=1 Tax=Hymenoscyphus fraxineus TaxID=746836 RepID=A0A9N9KWR0_9HELO|nr:hypothetical protein HYFRA_00011634 [Hymenoscyphus fraxineus]
MESFRYEEVTSIRADRAQRILAIWVLCDKNRPGTTISDTRRPPHIEKLVRLGVQSDEQVKMFFSTILMYLYHFVISKGYQLNHLSNELLPR